MLADLFAFLGLFFDLAWSAMWFGTSAFVRAALSPEARNTALLIAFLAGVSEMTGQSVILVINRIPLYRFLASLAFTGVTYIVTAIIWALATIIVAPLTQIGTLAPSEIAAAIGIIALSFSPRLFAFLSLAPYFGVALANFLEAWAMALVVFGLHVALDMPVGAALFCGSIGWLLSYGLRTYLGHLLARPLGRLRVLISGSALDRTPAKILDDLAKRINPERHS
ncbi:hypothetical protein ABFZ85_14605 [Hyphococcus formosus]|uniref:hypothetical protein n=1 Tax=Hyphococcus formosus TaxID=3143534 RepID=UPI00398AA979